MLIALRVLRKNVTSKVFDVYHNQPKPEIIEFTHGVNKPSKFHERAFIQLIWIQYYNEPTTHRIMAYKKITIDSDATNINIELSFFVDPVNTAIVHYDMRVFDGSAKIQEMDGVNNDAIVDQLDLLGTGANQPGRKIFVYTKGFFAGTASNNGNQYRVEAKILEDGEEKDKAQESCATNEAIGVADILIEFN